MAPITERTPVPPRVKILDMTARSLPARARDSGQAVNPIVITATWDAEAQVWLAESEPLHLVVEAPTVQALMTKLPGIVQDLVKPDDEEALRKAATILLPN